MILSENRSQKNKQNLVNFESEETSYQQCRELGWFLAELSCGCEFSLSSSLLTKMWFQSDRVTIYRKPGVAKRMSLPGLRPLAAEGSPIETLRRPVGTPQSRWCRSPALQHYREPPPTFQLFHCVPCCLGLVEFQAKLLSKTSCLWHGRTFQVAR